jgi:hypothetical protein
MTLVILGRVLLLFWNLHFAHAEGQVGKLKKKDLIKSLVDIIRSKFIMHYFPSATVTVDENTLSFKGRVFQNNPLKPVNFGLKMFVLSDSTNGYIYDFKLYTGKTGNGNSGLLITTQVLHSCALLL